MDKDGYHGYDKQEQGEPVAEISRDGVLGVDFIDIERALKLPNGTKLYTTPQQRTWVGLTDEEMRQVCYEIFSYDPYAIARVIEAKLKEKNTC